VRFIFNDIILFIISGVCFLLAITFIIYLLVTTHTSQTIKTLIVQKTSLVRDVTTTAATARELKRQRTDNSSKSSEKQGFDDFNEAALEGKYIIESEITGGGMSRVFLIRNAKLGNTWLLKYIPYWIGELASEDEILKLLNHPGLPQIVDIFNDRSGVYMVESYIDGVDLSDFLAVEGRVSQALIQDWALNCQML